jgi:predicted short-subunit dehydrogenase-like oxidoreductase (DUF2520 family)
MQQDTKIAIIGPGRAGLAIAAAGRRAGLNIVAIGARKQKRCEEAVSFLDQICAPTRGRTLLATDPSSAARQAQLIFLTVSDGAIRSLCNDLSEQKAFSPGAIVAHLSGALPSSILSSAHTECHCQIISAHPMQTFAPLNSGTNDLAGIHWFLEGDDEAIDVLAKFIKIIGGQPEIITAQNKPLYHIASVMASNYLTSLVDVAASILEEAGIDEHTSLQALEPLVKSALKNAFALGPEAALTGPISRGDILTIQAHLKTLSACDKNLCDIYKVLGQHTVKLSLRRGSIDQQQGKILMETFTKDKAPL